MSQVKKITLIMSKYGGVTEVEYDPPIDMAIALGIIDSTHLLWVLEMTSGERIKYLYGKRQNS